MMTASLFGGKVALTLDVAYDAMGPIVLTGPALLVDIVAHWLVNATGFEGHSVGYPIASPRDLRAALLYEGARFSASDIKVDDAKPLPPLADGWVR